MLITQDAPESGMQKLSADLKDQARNINNKVQIK